MRAAPSRTLRWSERSMAKASASTGRLNRRSSGDKRTGIDGDRCNQRTVRANEDVVADDGSILVFAVKIAGDGACTDVGVFTHFRIT